MATAEEMKERIVGLLTAEIARIEMVERTMAAKLQQPSKGAKKTRKLAATHRNHRAKAMQLRAFRSWLSNISMDSAPTPISVPYATKALDERAQVDAIFAPYE